MKKITAICLISAMIATLVACGDTQNETVGDTTSGAGTGTFEKVVSGYNGDVTVAVTLQSGEIMGIEVTNHKETEAVADRAIPLMVERILDAQTPIVDSVSGATFTSYAIKNATGQVMSENGIEVEAVTFATSGPAVTQVEAETVTTQVVVVGGGPAGLSAAITAKESGVSDVIVIEKLDILSGNGKFDLNFYDLYHSEAKIEAGNNMTKEEFLESEKNAFDTDERKDAWADSTLTVDSWLRDMGVELNYTYGLDSHLPEEDTYAGNYIQHGLEARANELGIDIRTGTAGIDLIMEDGVCVGVNAESKSEKYDILADAVIIATGGFSNNKEYLAEYAPGHEVLATSNQMGTTGDFIAPFIDNDIKLENMDNIRVFPVILSASRELTNSGAGHILVNQDGDRFTTETSGGLGMATDILDQDKAYYIFDTRLFDDVFRLEKQYNAGYYVSADTIGELAVLIGVDAEKLQDSIDEFNDLIGEDGTLFASDGPFYAGQVESAVHMTKGGVVANENAEILTNDNDVVVGLYAAGEVASQSGGYAQSVIFGRISGESAAEFIFNK